MEIVSKIQQFTDEDLTKLLAKLTKVNLNCDVIKTTIFHCIYMEICDYSR